jgi:hypothetical protein
VTGEILGLGFGFFFLNSRVFLVLRCAKPTVPALLIAYCTRKNKNIKHAFIPKKNRFKHVPITMIWLFSIIT